LQATAGAVAFEFGPHPKIAESESGQHERNNMSGKHSLDSATITSKAWGAALSRWPFPAAPEFGRYVALKQTILLKWRNYERSS